MGLLSDVWDYVRSKVKDLIAGSVTDLKVWVQNRIASAIDAVDWVVKNVINYVTNVYNTVKEYVTNVYNTVNEYITNVVENVTKYVSNVYNTTNQYITNVTNNTTQYITNVIGVTQAALDKALADNRGWMQNFFKLMDPGGFLKDPLGFINAAFAIQGEIVNNLAVKSFWEGFEEGLTEEVV